MCVCVPIGGSTSAVDKSKLRMAIKGPPVIVVPNSLTGCLSSYNAMDFLGPDGKYISIEDKKKLGGRREKEIKIRIDENR